MNAETAAKYGPAAIAAPLGALDPVFGGIAFGMVTGWLAIAGVMYEQRKPLNEIWRALCVSLLIGGGGALFAAYAVQRLHLDPLGAAMIAFGIAFGGVKTIKLIGRGAMAVVEWVVSSAIDDAARMGRKRQEAQKLLEETDRENRERLDRTMNELIERDRNNEP